MRKRNVKGLLFAAAFMIAGTQLTSIEALARDWDDKWEDKWEDRWDDDDDDDDDEQKTDGQEMRLLSVCFCVIGMKYQQCADCCGVIQISVLKRV